MHTVYLLGAGASHDAGLPMSLGLADKIGEYIANKEVVQPSPYDYEPKVSVMTQAYYATRALLQAGDDYAGRPPTGGMDIERIFSAAQALATLDEAELAPFVQQWREPFQLQPDPMEWKYFISSIQEYDPDPERSHHLGGLLRPPVPNLQGVYRQLCTEICETLPRVLTAEQPECHRYLLPMLEANDTNHIATLNYDLGVETAAQLGELSVDTGITKWRGGLRWRWDLDNPDVKLLKLHGSLNWGRPYGEGGYLAQGTPRITTEGSEDYDLQYVPHGLEVQPPGLIFGVRNKLRPDGPFMAMLHEFWCWLERAERLVVIGYSFRDEHINNLIQDWITLRPGSTLEIVDPSTPESWFECTYATPSFVRWALQFHYREARGCPEHPLEWIYVKTQFKFHRPGAAAWLKGLSLPH